MLLNKNTLEYSLEYNKEMKLYSIVLNEGLKSEIKWVSFSLSDSECFLLQGYLLGSLRYANYSFKFSKYEKNKLNFIIEDKNKNNYIIVSGYLYINEPDYKNFILLLEERVNEGDLLCSEEK